MAGRDRERRPPGDDAGNGAGRGSIRDAEEPLAHLGSGGQVAPVLQGGADGYGVRFGHEEHERDNAEYGESGASGDGPSPSSNGAP